MFLGACSTLSDSRFGRNAAPATNGSTARETASPGAVADMPQVRDLRRISALRGGFPSLAGVAPLTHSWPLQCSDQSLVSVLTESKHQIAEKESERSGVGLPHSLLV